MEGASKMAETKLPPVLERMREPLSERGYTLDRQLSESGSHGPSGSTVWLAYREDNPVALKIASYGLLDRFDGANADKILNFVQRERNVLEQAGNHPNIPSYIEGFDITTEEDWAAYFTAMQYLDAETVEQLMKRGRTLSEDEAKMILRDDISALSHLHNIVQAHRDIKPGNIFVNGENAYLSDFDVVNMNKGTSHTELRAFYYPMDIFSGVDQNPSQDLVALGNVVVSGALAKKIGAIRYEQGKGGLEQVDTSKLHYSKELRDYLHTLTSDPDNRYQTAQEALEALDRHLGMGLEAREGDAVISQAREAGYLTTAETKETALTPTDEISGETDYPVSKLERAGPLILKPNTQAISKRRLKGEFGEEFLERYKEESSKLGNPKVLDVLNFSRVSLNPFRGVIQGGNTFSGTLASKVLKEMGYRSATRQDLEEISLKRLRFLLNYVDVGVALRTRQDSREENKLITEILYDDMTHYGFDVESNGGKLISFNALSLEKHSLNYGGLVLRLNPGKATQKDIIDINHFRWDFARDEGLSRAYLSCPNWFSGIGRLEYSSGYGRVVVVEPASQVRENFSFSDKE